MSTFIKKIKQYLKESTASAILDQIVTLLISTIITFLLGRFGIVFNDSISLGYKFLILTAAFMFVYLIILLIQMRPTRYLFNINNLDIVVEYQGDCVDVYGTYTITSNRLRLSKIYTRRTWYPNESSNLEMLTEGYSVEKINNNGLEYQEYYMVFPKPIHLGQTITFKTRYHGENKTRQFKNFYWYDFISPVSVITIDAHIPHKYCKDRIECYYFRDHKNAPDAVHESFSYDGAYKWEKKYPRVHWSCSYEWEWSDSEKKIIEEKARDCSSTSLGRGLVNTIE